MSMPEDLNINAICRMAEKHSLHAGIDFIAVSEPRGDAAFVLFPQWNSTFDQALAYHSGRKWLTAHEHIGWIRKILSQLVGDALLHELDHRGRDVMYLPDLDLVVRWYGWPDGESGKLMRSGFITELYQGRQAQGLVAKIFTGEL